MWQLRANLTAYDATYVALAEALDCTLLSGDARLAAAPGPTSGSAHRPPSGDASHQAALA